METEWVAKRMELHRLLRRYPHWSAPRLAQAVAMSESWVKKWRRRFRESGQPSMQLFRSRSRAPHHPPQRISPVVQEVILTLRDQLRERYFRTAGPKLIHYHLHHDPTVQPPQQRLPQSPTTIWKILKAGGRIKRRVRVHLTLERPEPMVEWEMDFGVTQSVGGPEGVEFFAAIDRGTSIMIHSDVQERFHAETALLTVAEMFLVNGLPQRLRFDRDARLFGSWTRDSYPSPLMRFLRCLGINPIPCPPRRPDKKPFIERLIGTLKHECLFRYRPTHRLETARVLEDFRAFYNQERPNQALSCDNRPPQVAFPHLPRLPVLPDSLNPNAWLNAYDGRVFRRRINANGSFMVDRYRYYVGNVHAGKPVLVHLDAQRREFFVSYNGALLARKAMQGIHQETMNFQDYLRLMMEEARSIEQFRETQWQQHNEEERF